MNYFDQLLESYSRLKKRKLVLLEKEEESKKTDTQRDQEKAATQDNEAALKLFTADFNAADTERTEANQSAREAENAPYYWKAEVNSRSKLGQTLATNSGGEKPIVIKAIYNQHQSQGQTVDQLKQYYPKAYQELLNYYMGDQSSNMLAAIGGASLEAIQNMPGAKLKEAIMAMIPEGDTSETVENAIQRIAASMTKLTQDARAISEMARSAGVKEYFAGYIKREAKGKTPASEGYSSPNAINTFITGDAGQSISRVLRQGATARLNPDTGLDFVEIVRDPDFIARALDSITALTELAGPKNPDDSRGKCDALSQKVMKRGKKLVFLTGPGSDGNAEGIVIPENSFLSYVSQEAQKRCGAEIQEVPRSYNANELNSVRGPAFETGIVGASIFGALINEKDDLLKEAVLNDLVGWMDKELNQDSRKFAAAMVKLRRFRDLDSAEDIQGADLSDLFEDFDRLTNTPEKFQDFMELITKLREVQSSKMDIGSDMSFPVAKEKGIGYADDIIDLFRDKKKADKGAKKIGLEDGSEEITIGELRAKDPVLTSIFERMYYPGGASDDTILYRVGEGVKAYENPTEVKIGEAGRLERRSDVILRAGVIAPKGTPKVHYVDKDGVVRKRKKKDIEKSPEVYDGNTPYLLEEYNIGTAEKVQERLWGSNKSEQQAGLASSQRYQKDVLDNTKEVIDSLLPSDMTLVKDDDGNILDLNYDTFHSIVDDRIERFSFNDTTKKTLKTIFMTGNVRKNLKDKTTRLKAREELNRLLINVQQYSHMSYDGNDPSQIQRAIDAKNNLAYTVGLLGDVKHDSTITSMGINKKSILVTSHSKTINKYTQGLLRGTVDFQLGGDGFSLKLVDRDDPKKNISQRTMRSGMTADTANTETDIIISSGALEEFAVVNETISGKTERDDQSLMISFLKGQQQLLEKLLAN
jgi:hypothetical protein